MKTVQLSLEACQDIFGDWITQKAKEHGLDGLDADLVNRWLADEISANADIYRDAEGVFQPHPDFAASIVQQAEADFADRINQTLVVMNSVLAHTFEGQGSDQAAFATFLKSKFKDPNLICDTSDPKKLEAFADALCARFWEEFDRADEDAFEQEFYSQFYAWQKDEPFDEEEFEADAEGMVEFDFSIEREESLGAEISYEMDFGHADGEFHHISIKLPIEELKGGELSEDTVNRLHQEVSEMWMYLPWQVEHHDASHNQFVSSDDYDLQEFGRFTPAEQARIDELVEYIHSVDQSSKPQP